MVGLDGCNRWLRSRSGALQTAVALPGLDRLLFQAFVWTLPALLPALFPAVSLLPRFPPCYRVFANPHLTPFPPPPSPTSFSFFFLLHQKQNSPIQRRRSSSRFTSPFPPPLLISPHSFLPHLSFSPPSLRPQRRLIG